MSIKYAEISIFYNTEEESIFRTISRFFGYDLSISNIDKIIISFDNDSIYDINELYEKQQIKFGPLGYKHGFPIYFDLENNYLFYKQPKKENGIFLLNYNNIFKNLKNYSSKHIMPSAFNLIYEDSNKIDKLAIARIKSNDDKPRFKIGYDESKIDKKKLIYLLYTLFKYNFTNINS